MICQLGSSLLAQSVSSAAMGQLSSAPLLSEGSVQLITQLSGQLQLSCTLSNQMKPVILATTCWLSFVLSPHLDSVLLAAVCQLNCVLSAWL
jgi:hypothetical protein